MHYAHFYLNSCFHDQSSYFMAYRLLSHMSQNRYAKYVIRIYFKQKHEKLRNSSSQGSSI